ncbi:E3 ubiquitin protein ligase UPL3-like protein [Tanacetum coccineum]
MSRLLQRCMGDVLPYSGVPGLLENDVGFLIYGLEIEFPLRVAAMEFIDPRAVTVIPILRAGLALAQHASSILPATKTYHLDRESFVSSTMEHAPIARPLPTTYLAPPMKSYKSYNEGIDEEFMEDDFEYSMEELWELLEIMGEFNVDQQYAFCRFHTGVPRLPPSGLVVLNPKLTILRKLPPYSTKLPLLKDSLRLEKPVTKMTPIVEPTNDLALLLELISSTGYCYQ